MNLKRIIFRTALLMGVASVLLFTGCGLPGTEQAGSEGSANRDILQIYTAGYYFNGKDAIACYWITKDRTNLCAGGANSIFVYKGVILVAGFFKEDYQSNACYWRNNYLHILPSNGYESYATSITYGGGNVYTAGHWQTSHACYWKGKKRTELSGEKATSVYVYGGVPYIAGSYLKNSQRYACYWRGTSRTTLPGPSGYSTYATSIFVYNGTVYTAGWYYNSKTRQDVACYWTGTKRTDLSGSIAHAIFVYNGTVYTAGKYYRNSRTTACYWTGRTRTTLSTPSSYVSEAKSIYVLGGKVYTSGGYGPSDYNPCYWVGTSRTNLPGGTYGMANSIFVTN